MVPFEVLARCPIAANLPPPPGHTRPEDAEAYTAWPGLGLLGGLDEATELCAAGRGDEDGTEEDSCLTTNDTA